MITTLCHRVIDFVIPPRCAGCDVPVCHPRLWCTECADSVARLSQKPIPHTEQGYRVISPFVYGGPVANAVHRFKYSNRPELARALAAPIAERLLLANLPKCVLVPVPSTPERIVERGYNVVHWTDMPRGGHFASLEEPELFLADLRAFVWAL